MEPIYLDHNATTPVRPEALEAMARAATDYPANPSSRHLPGQRARRKLEETREAIAALLGADLTSPQPDRLLFTSGGTEANNLAVLGIGRAGRGPGAPRLVISAAEHSSVLGPAERLLDKGWQVDTLGLDPQGRVRVEQLGTLLIPATRLVSVILANHEMGVVQPIAEIAAQCQAAGVPLHTDAVQAAGKMPVAFRRLGVAAMSATAHKFHGPLGIGALLLKEGVALDPLLFGGPQQGGLRPGTEMLALAVGMHEALRLACAEMEAERRRLAALRDRFEARLRSVVPNAVIHGAAAERLPNTSNVAFPGLDGQVFFTALDMAGVACSIGSACNSGSTELSPTLSALGIPTALVGSSLRFSLGRTTTEADIDKALGRIEEVATALSA